MAKKVFVGPDTIFNNAQCMFVEYYDVIKCPWFALLTCIKDEPSLENIFDLTPVRSLDIACLFEWYINRKHRNFYKDLLIPNENITDESFCDRILESHLKLTKDFYSDSLELNFANVIRGVCNDKKLLHNIIIYTEEENEFIKEDIEKMYNGNATYTSGKFEDVISRIPRDSTFVFSDIEKINKLQEMDRLDYSSIIMCDGYRYNNKDKNTLKVDIDELRTKSTFKIDFVDNLNSL